MATSEGPDTLVNLLVMEKQLFWQNHSDLPEQERQCLWNGRVKELNSALYEPAPVQPSNIGFEMLEKTKATTSSVGMTRRCTESTLSSRPGRGSVSFQPSAPMSRKRSSPPGTSIAHQVCIPDASSISLAGWQSGSQESGSTDRGPDPGPAKLRRMNSGQRHPSRGFEITTDLSPEEYLRQTDFDAGSHSQISSPVGYGIPASTPRSSQFNSQYASSISSMSPIIASLADATAASQTMSRHSSHISSIYGGVDMLRFLSQTSDSSESYLNGEQSPCRTKHPLDLSEEGTLNLPNLDSAHLVGQAGAIQQDGPPNQACLAPPTLRSQESSPRERVSMERAKSDGSSSLSASRTILFSSSSERPLAPKPLDGNVSSSQDLSSPHQMVRVQSADGNITEKYLLPKSTYSRPVVREKVKCTQCNAHPNGFRGPHELQRHVDRVHSSDGKVWICIDNSADGTVLSKCKSCQRHKPYNQYYNAAAHLRRVHFNPKQKKARKVGGKSVRAGHGGGSWPPMDSLKKHWMKQVQKRDLPDPPARKQRQSDKSQQEQDDYDDDDDDNSVDYDDQIDSYEMDDTVGQAEQVGELIDLEGNPAKEVLPTSPPSAYHHVATTDNLPLDYIVPRHFQLDILDQLQPSPSETASFYNAVNFDISSNGDPPMGGFNDSLLNY